MTLKDGRLKNRWPLPIQDHHLMRSPPGLLFRGFHKIGSAL